MNKGYNPISFDAVNNPSFKNLTFVTSINFNSKTASILSQFDEEGNLMFVGTDPILNATNDNDNPNSNCGFACRDCETDWGCAICWIGCKWFRMDFSGGTDKVAFSKINPGDIISLDGMKFTQYYSNDNVERSNSSRISVYKGERLISAINYTFNDNLTIANILVFFEGDPSAVGNASTEFGKCLMDCGKTAKSDWGAALCAWDCLARMPQHKSLFEN